MIYIIIAIVFVLIVLFIVSKPNQNSNNVEVFPYDKKALLTNNELKFYKSLSVYANENNYHILSKIRLADLVCVRKSEKESQKYFNKIKSKHIDFALCKKENLDIVYLIELDDKSHNQQNRIKRDAFLNNLSLATDYKLIRIKSNEDINEVITKFEMEQTKKATD